MACENGRFGFPILSDVNFYDALVASIPLGRIAEPEDVWNAALSLCRFAPCSQSLRSWGWTVSAAEVSGG